MWEVTYDDGSTEQYKDMTLSLLSSYIDERKKVIKIVFIDES